MSSLGDIVHTLPAITDIIEHCPEAQIDWLVDQSFAQIPTWHPSINRVFAVPLRRWKKSLFKMDTWREYARFKKEMSQQTYDYVIDAQGLLKSVWLARKVTGQVYGYDKNSIREPSASYFYQHTFRVSRELHAVERIRQLCAQVLDYQPDMSVVNYRLQLELSELNLSVPYIVFAHATTWEAKHFPEEYWIALADQLQGSRAIIYLPWVNEIEKARAERIAENRDWVQLLPKVSLNQIAAILQNAKAVVGVDTGLSHIAAAVDTPVVAIYGATSAGLARPYGQRVWPMQSQFHCSPCMQKQCVYVKEGKEITPPCYGVIDLDGIVDDLMPYLRCS